MENEQRLDTPSHSDPLLPDSRQEFPASLPQPEIQQQKPLPTRATLRPRKQGRSPWYYVGLLVVGLGCFLLLTILAALVWGSIVYTRQGYLASGQLLPLTIFLCSIFFSSCLVTALARGGTIVPALLFFLLANLASFLATGLPAPATPHMTGLLLKLGYSLLAAVAGFTVTKLLIVKKRGKFRA